MSEDIRVEYVPLGEIVGADVNPKDHDIGQIYQSMKRFGFTSPVMLNEQTGKLMAGHGRLETLAMLKREINHQNVFVFRRKTESGSFQSYEY